MFYYALLAVFVGAALAVGVLLWVVMSPVVRAMARGHAIDPAQWGRWQEHLEDDGLGPSWRSDGSGGKRETKVYSKHTRRH